MVGSSNGVGFLHPGPGAGEIDSQVFRSVLEELNDGVIGEPVKESDIKN